MGPFKFLCVLLGPYWFIGLDVYLCLINCLIGPYARLWVVMKPSRSLSVPMGFYGSLYVLMNPPGSLLIFMHVFASL